MGFIDSKKTNVYTVYATSSTSSCKVVFCADLKCHTDLGLRLQFFPSLCVLCWVGDESHIDQTGLLDMRLQSLTHHGDAFGDEDKGFDLLGSDCVLIFFCHILAKRTPCTEK